MRGHNIQVEAKSLLPNSGSPETPCSVPLTCSLYSISVRVDVRVFPEFPLLVPFIVLLPLSVSALAY